MEEIIGFLILILVIAAIIVAVYEFVDDVKQNIKSEIDTKYSLRLTKMEYDVACLKDEIKKLKQNVK